MKRFFPSMISQPATLRKLLFCYESLFILGFHSEDGLLTVEDNVATTLSDIYRDASLEIGYQVVDCNGQNQTGNIGGLLVFMVNFSAINSESIEQAS